MWRNVRETFRMRECAVHCSGVFSNVAGELTYQWVDGNDNEILYRPDVKGDQEDIVRTDGRASGSTPFQCVRPPTENEISKLEQVPECVVICPDHKDTDNRADCVDCHARKSQLVGKCIPVKERVHEIKRRGVQKVHAPLTSTKEVPMFAWVSKAWKKLAFTRNGWIRGPPNGDPAP